MGQRHINSARMMRFGTLVSAAPPYIRVNVLGQAVSSQAAGRCQDASRLSCVDGLSVRIIEVDVPRGTPASSGI